MSTSLLFSTFIILFVPLISAGTLYGVATPGGRKLDVYTIDPQVGKATANVTSFYLMNMDATCNKLLLSYDNRTQELGLSCDDNLYFVDIWWNWRVSSVMNSGLWGKGTVVNIVPSWDDYYEGNCALTLYPPSPTSGLKDAPMGSVTCFALGAESQLSIAYGPYYWIKKTQPFVFSTPSKQIGIFNYISNRDFILWGKSLADNSSNIVALDQRSVTLEAWDSFMKFNVDINQLSGSTSYSHPLMGNITVIELTTGVIVLDLNTKTMSNVVSFCQGHAKIGSSAFDPVNKMMYSLVSCYSGPMLVTFDIKNNVVKNAVKFDESALYIKGLFYTL